MLDGVQHLCPYLALGDDGRSVVDGYDPDHACHAVRPAIAVDRTLQVQLCLTESHPRCERLVAAQQTLAAGSSRRPAPDLVFLRSRLVLRPEGGWGTRVRRPLRSATRRRGRIGVVVLIVLLALGATVTAAIYGAWIGPNLPPASSFSPTPSSATGSSSPQASAAATTSSEPSPSSTASASPVASPTPAASQLTYEVQPGDTLNAIALQFGVSLEALRAVNGITDPDNVIVPGQVLIIP